MTTIDAHYWQQRWQQGQTGWDIGKPAPAIVAYFALLDNKALQILIPGCGNAYEAGALWELGFKNITVAEIAPLKAGALREQFKETGIRVIEGDFFDMEGQYDIIVEHTFFCSLPPERRHDYARKSFELLRDNGQVTGLLFNRIFDQQGPPFGGSREEYRSLFTPIFRQVSLEPCHTSIAPRAGNELFITLTK